MCFAIAIERNLNLDRLVVPDRSLPHQPLQLLRRVPNPGNPSVDDDLRRERAAETEAADVVALAGVGVRVAEQLDPAEVVPVRDVVSEQEDVWVGKRE